MPGCHVLQGPLEEVHRQFLPKLFFDLVRLPVLLVRQEREDYTQTHPGVAKFSITTASVTLIMLMRRSHTWRRSTTAMTVTLSAGSMGTQFSLSSIWTYAGSQRLVL